MLQVVYTPDVIADGNIEGWIASIVDVTDRRLAETQRDWLITEVNHRVKNTLATVLSIAHQSFKKRRSFEQSISSFENRIRALAQTHTRLAETNWSGVPLQTIIDDEMAPYRTDGNVRAAGPDIRLSPRCALSLAMAFHELATNAAKYGGLSAQGGSVEVKWETDQPARELRLCWVERGGPTVRPPKTSGFGRRLLEKGVASDLEGTVQLHFGGDGVTCLITFPLGRQAAPADEVVAGKLNHLTGEVAPKVIWQ
jgi:two-component sensor histidine kinase